jgi:adenine/guanine phosphoribosyltransferase-like PRPP-binding protein
MRYSSPLSVSPWVRNAICIVACLSVPGLIFAAYHGAQLNLPLIFVVGSFASATAFYAFRR